MNQRFTYLRPTSIAEAVMMLQDKCSKAKVLAGGTDLLVQMRRDVIKSNYLISLKNLPLNFIEKVNSGIRIGSITTIGPLARSGVIREKFYGFVGSISHDRQCSSS